MQEIISPEKRGTLMEPLKHTEPHYVFCGTLGSAETLLKNTGLKGFNPSQRRRTLDMGCHRNECKLTHIFYQRFQS